jgi:hypothetical protein
MPRSASPLLPALCMVFAGLARGAPWSGVHSVDIADPDYRMTAFTVAVPNGWKFAGEVARDVSCHGKGAGLKTMSAGPDGLSAVGFLPGFRWNWSTSVFQREAMANSRCPGIDIDSAAAFLVNIAVPNMHPRATIVSVQPLDGSGRAALAAQLQSARQSADAAAARYGIKPQTLSLTGARVRIRYVMNGRPVEEQLQSIVDCSESQMPALYVQPAYTRRNCSARNVFVVRAAQGHLDELLNAPELASLTRATQMNPDWLARLTRDQQAQFRQWQAQNDQAFQAILRKGQADHAALMQQGAAFQQQEQQRFQQSQAQDRATQHAIDAAAHGQVLDSLGRQEFRNPDTGQVIQASSYYSHQWLSSDGSTLIQTDDPTLNPNGAVYPVAQSWTELVPK